MKERGIIFNSEMVRAILDGRKTQTRRVMNNQPCTLPGETISVQQDDFNFRWAGDLHNDTSGWFPCPFGKVGDRLWVRETFCIVHDEQFGEENWIDYRATPKYSDKKPAGWDAEPNDPEALNWAPSIHMPRWASRIKLEITDVRVERLQAASDDDFKAEGYPLDRELTGGSTDAFCWFRHLWDSVSKPDCNFESNPWVWVVEFKKVE